jgi:phenylacetate-CoA ligase
MFGLDRAIVLRYYRGSMPGLSVVCPCLNEAASLSALVARVDAVLSKLARDEHLSVELVLIDDGSIDDTWARMEAQRLTSPIVRTVRHARRRGIAEAWSSGALAARGEWICVLDADLQYEPEQIPLLWSALRDTGADIVQGSRDVRFLLSRGLNEVLNRVFGMSLRDNKSGFFLCRRALLRELLASRHGYRHWQCLVMVAAHHGGYRIHEVDTPFHSRYGGRSAFGALALRPTVAVALDVWHARADYRSEGA